jgi:hypothetical protein
LVSFGSTFGQPTFTASDIFHFNKNSYSGKGNISIFDDSNLTSTALTSSDTSVMYAYTICGSLLALMGIILFTTYAWFGGIYVVSTQHHVHRPEQFAQDNTIPRNIFIVLLIALYLLQALFSETYSNFAVSFSVSQLGWSTADGTYLLSAAAAFALAVRIIMIYLVRVISSGTLILVGIALCASIFLLQSFLVNIHWVVMWICTIAYYSSESIYQAVILAYQDKYVGIEGYLGITYPICSALIGAVASPVLGDLIENISPMYLLYVWLASSATCLVLVVVMQVIGKLYVERKMHT